MGVDSRNIYRGACSHPGCTCTDFQRSPGTSKCSVCNHPPTNHKALDSSQHIAPCNTDSDKEGKESHITAPSGGHSDWDMHYRQPHHHSHPMNDFTGWKTCSTCGTGYPVDLRACPECSPREACKNHQCDKPAFFTLELGSFGYCSAECRDKCELEGAKRELTRALGGFEVNPGRGSTQTPVKEPVSQDPTSQPLTRASLRSADTSTTEGATHDAPPTHLQSEDTPAPATEATTHGAPPTQQPSPPQVQASVSLHCKVSRDAVRAMSFYDNGRLQTVRGTKGILVTSIEVNKDTLDCSVQPLDLITQVDGKSIESLCDNFKQCFLKVKMTQSSAVMWVARTSGVPSLSDLQIEGLVKPHQSGRKHRIVGFLVTEKELVDPASYLGVKMYEFSKRKVDHVTVMSEGYKAGLHCNDIIQSVTMVTAEGIVGPDKEWSFEGIKRIAGESQSVCALLLTVMNF